MEGEGYTKYAYFMAGNGSGKNITFGNLLAIPKDVLQTGSACRETDERACLN